MLEFHFISEGLDGTTPRMRWVELSDGRRGVFKPWDSCSFESEVAYSKVAEFFGVEVSKCVKVDGGFVSLQSYNKRMTQVPAYELPFDFCLTEFAKHMPESVMKQLVCMMYLDTICNNTDRHEGNLSFLTDARGNVVSVCPMYDNCNCFGNSYERQSLFAPDISKVWGHHDVFRWLIREYPFVAEWTLRYMSKEFEVHVKDLYYGEWILENRNYLFDK